MTLRDYLGVMWRRKWIILLVVVVATASAFFFSYSPGQAVRGQADLIYQQQLDVANPLTGQTYTDTNERNLELRIVSIDVLSRARTSTARRAGALEQQGRPPRATRSELPSPGPGHRHGRRRQQQRRRASPPRAGARARRRRGQRLCRRQFVNWTARSPVQAQISGPSRPFRTKLARPTRASPGNRTDYLILQQRLQDLQILRPRPPATTGCSCRRRCRRRRSRRSRCAAPLLGFGVGLFVGIGLAFLLEQFDTRAAAPGRDRRAPAPADPRPRAAHLAASCSARAPWSPCEHPDGHVAEAFRMVRTNLDFMAVDGDVRSSLAHQLHAGRGQERHRRQPRRHAWRWPARRSSSWTPTCGGRGSTSSSVSRNERG